MGVAAECAEVSHHLTEQEFHSMKFSCQVETSSSLNPVEPAPSKSSPGLNWDIEVQVDQVRLVSEPPVRENIVFAAQTTRASEPPIVEKPISISSSSSSHTSKKSVSQTTSMSTSMKSSSQSSTTMTSKKSTSSRNVQINVGSKRSVVTVSANSLADERKLSKLMNPRGRKVTRQGDWLVFTEKVGILTSQNGVQQVREERVRINSEDLGRLVSLGF